MITKNFLLGFILFSLIFSVSLFSCTNRQEAEPEIKIQNPNAGGKFNSVEERSSLAFSLSSPGLVGEQNLKFFVGNSLFKQNWVIGPASTTARDGLGPIFNARSCGACHNKDGKGSVESSNNASRGLLLRLYPDFAGDQFKGQLQTQAIPGFEADGSFSINKVDSIVQYSDGKKVNLKVPKYEIQTKDGQTLTTEFSPRIGQQVFGLGLLEGISDERKEEIINQQSLTDEISGKLIKHWSATKKEMLTGVFGWKSEQPLITDQSSDAFAGDIGISSSFKPDEESAEKYLGQEVIEVTEDNLNNMEIYLANLAVPTQRKFLEADWNGKIVFEKIGCASCHIPNHITDTNSKYPNLSNQEIQPYTDLLLHDMGPSLSDPSNDPIAKEWRTPPLWGLGLLGIVNGNINFLHDGRAESIEEAILWHGGEANETKKRFMSLSKQERSELIQFVEKL